MLLEISTSASAARDPGSGVFLTLDPGWEKSESGTNVPDLFSESLVTILWVKNTQIRCQFSVLDPDPVLFLPLDSESRKGENPDPE
jgi:hypothetical protein